ncbi:hypothetical protein ACFL02_00120 [Planctomycetota bacterium]
MKRDKTRSGLKKAARESADSGGVWDRNRKIFAVFFGSVLIFILVLKAYKAHYTGVIYDEAMTQRYFGGDIDKALHPTTITNPNVPLTNNHVLNSIFIYYAHQIRGSYEHFIRIPSLAAGIIFSLALAYIICKTIRSYVLRTASLLLISLTPFVFDYSFLARGYAFVLAAIFTQIALVLYLLDRKIKFQSWLIPALIISALNFLAFGALFSSIIYLTAFNLTFILFCSPRIFRDPPPFWKPVILMGVSIFLVSLASVYLLYHGMYEDVISGEAFKEIGSRWRGWSSFLDLLYRLLAIKVFKVNNTGGAVNLGALVLLLAVSIGYYIYKLRSAVKQGFGRKYLWRDDPALLLFLVTSLSLIFMFVYGVILNKSIGLERNNVILVPMVLISAVIILDRFASSLGKNYLTHIARAVVATVIIAVILHNPPSTRFISGATISGPLLRKLKAVDPYKTWNIGFTKQTRLYPMSFGYYQQFDYNFDATGNIEQPDVTVCLLKEIPPNIFCLEKENFSKSGCAVILNPSFPFDRVVLDVKLR